MSNLQSQDNDGRSSSVLQNTTANPASGNPPSNAPASSSTTMGPPPRRQRTDTGLGNSDSLLARFKSVDPHDIPTTIDPNPPPAPRAPFQDATSIQHAMWRLIDRKVYSGSARDPVRFRRRDETSLRTIATIPNVYNMIEQFNTRLFASYAGNSAAYAEEPVFALRMYLEGALDGAAICQQVWKHHFAPAENIRHIIQRLHDHFQDRVHFRFGTRAQHGMTTLLFPNDFQGFLHDPNNEGWLSQNLVNAILLAGMTPPITPGTSLTTTDKFFLVDSAQIATLWTHFTLNNLQAGTTARLTLPTNRQQGFNLLIPIWIGQQCSLATVTWSTNRIQYYNSNATGYDVMRTTAFSFVEWILARRGAYRGRAMTRGNLHEVRQSHFCDCGVLVVETGLAFIEGRVVRVYNPSLRERVAGDLEDRCMSVGVPDWSDPNTPRVTVRQC